MEVFGIQDSWRGGVATASARIRPSGDSETHELWFRITGVDRPLDGLAEAMVVGLLTPCMYEREAISINAPIASTLAANLTEAQNVLACWYDNLKPIQIISSGRTDAAAADAPPRGVACCFSAGVDSWYSLLKHETRVSHLLLVRGLDIGLGNDTLWSAAHAGSAAVADAMGVRLVTCETNLRDIADKRRARWGRPFDGDFWGERLHGAALASVALLLRRTVGELIIPSTHSYAQIKPWGSSPLLDHFWSDGHVKITHDGCEAGRVDKVRSIVRSDLALGSLRVCYYDTNEINCGRCEKCLRTLMALRIYGALDRATTFPRDVTLSTVLSLVVPPHLRHHYVMLRDEARRVGDDALADAVAVLLNERLSVRHAFARLKHAVRSTAFGRQLRRYIARTARAPAAASQ